MLNTTQIASLASRIKITTLNTGAWRANRLNRAESNLVNQNHNSGDAAKVIVRLTDNAALLGLYKLHAEAYAEHRRLTLPSVQDGMRIVPAGKEFEHAKIMREFSVKHDSLIQDFLADYDSIKDEARIKLNGLFNENQWPHKDTVASKFMFQIRYLNCPHEGAWSDWLNESAQAGESELRERLVTAARHLAKVCDGDGKLYQSAIDNLTDVCALAGDGFNLLDDSIIAKAASAIKVATDGLKAESLRDNKSQRKDTGAAISSILSGCNL